MNKKIVTGAVLLYNNCSVENFSFEIDVSNSDKENFIELKKEYTNERGKILKAHHIYKYTVIGSNWVHKSDSRPSDTKDNISGSYETIEKSTSQYSTLYYKDANITVVNADEYTAFTESMMGGEISYSQFSTSIYGISGSFGVGIKVGNNVSGEIKFSGEMQNGTSITAKKSWSNDKIRRRVRLLKCVRSYNISAESKREFRYYVVNNMIYGEIIDLGTICDELFIPKFSPSLSLGHDEDVKGE